MVTILDVARERLRHAVRTGSCVEAQSCLAEYTRALNADLAAAGPDGPCALQTVTSALDLLRWADRAARCERAHAAAVLARLTRARAYRPAHPQPDSILQVEA